MKDEEDFALDWLGTRDVYNATRLEIINQVYSYKVTNHTIGKDKAPICIELTKLPLDPVFEEEMKDGDDKNDENDDENDADEEDDEKKDDDDEHDDDDSDNDDDDDDNSGYDSESPIIGNTKYIPDRSPAPCPSPPKDNPPRDPAHSMPPPRYSEAIAN
ncbi:PREDICTED: cation channel sperm-associated protein 2-like [Ipomoea nil]|uniref:cation channel sperm-associated protein 2-like n=1 Tax=Ipomoea nil TaxID=35883 RepID=UPI000901D5B9|nr:PREDICTED: cation channel sperm-associated protein 2-like [Ipomoea nil]